MGKIISDKEAELIIDEYFTNGFNGTAAYQAIVKNENVNSSAVLFNRLLNRVKVQDYISKKYEHAKHLYKTTHGELLKTLYDWANSDITETIGLSPDDVKKLPKSIRKLITKYKHEKRTVEGVTTEIIELHFVSKEKAMDMISRHVGLFEKDNNQKQPPIFALYDARENK